MKSMTGFGSARVATPKLKAEITLRSLNNRYLDLSVQLPSSLLSLEKRIRDAVSERVRRGKVELGIRLTGSEAPSFARADQDAARAAAQALRELAQAAGLREEPGLSHLMAVEGVLLYDRGLDPEELWTGLEPGIRACLDDFDADRAREGQSARADMDRQLAVVEASLGLIAERAGELESFIVKDLRARFVQVMGDLADEARILSETAAYLAKHTINEELVRLRAHLDAFHAAMDDDQCGKKLDFICQELNREANTIGSKSAQVEVSQSVIRLKDAIENIREQVRNVE